MNRQFRAACKPGRGPVWRGRQWSVTSRGDIKGLRTGRFWYYAIAAARLTEEPSYSWPEHMAGKTAVDIEDFIVAFEVALKLTGKTVAGLDDKLERARECKRRGDECAARLAAEARAMGYGDEPVLYQFGADGRPHPVAREEVMTNETPAPADNVVAIAGARKLQTKKTNGGAR